MALTVEPTDLPRWSSTVAADPAYVVEPAEGNKDTGFVPGKPLRVTMNWILSTIYLWIVYFQSKVNAYSQEYDVIVNTTDPTKGTHASLTAALADAGVIAGMKILVVDAQTVNISAIVVSKAVEIVFKPLAGLTAGTSANGLSITTTGVRVKGGKISGFSGYGVQVDAAANRVKLGEIDFQTNTTDIDDQNGNSVNWGCSFSS